MTHFKSFFLHHCFIVDFVVKWRETLIMTFDVSVFLIFILINVNMDLDKAVKRHRLYFFNILYILIDFYAVEKTVVLQFLDASNISEVCYHCRLTSV